MIKKRRLIATAVVFAVGVIAACLGPHLSETRQESIIASPSSPINFGTFPVGSGSSMLITLGPGSGSDQSYQIGSAAHACGSSWTVNLPALPATVSRMCGLGTDGTTGRGPDYESNNLQLADSGDAEEPLCIDQVYNFDLGFNPQFGGAHSCSIMFQTSGGPVNVMAFGNGMAATFNLTTDRSTVNIGDVRVGDTGSGAFNVTNAGTQTLNVSITSSQTVGYTVTPPSFALGSGSSQQVNVNCMPPAGPYDSTITVSSQAPPRMLTAKCTGVMSDITLSPAPLDLQARVGEGSQRQVTIQNKGSAMANVTSVTLVPNPSTLVLSGVPGSGFMLAPNGSAQVTVTYTPTAKQMPAIELSKLTVVHDGANMRSLVVNGGATQPMWAISPDGEVDFGAVCIGATETKSVEVKGGADGDFILNTPGTATSPFAFRIKPPGTLPQTIKGNGATTVVFDATVTPTGNPGPLMGTVVLNGDIPADRTRTLNLKAEALAAGVGASKKFIEFPGVVRGMRSSPQSTVIRNCGAAPLQISNVAITGISADEFLIDSPAAGDLVKTIAPMGQEEYMIVGAPISGGAKIADLVITTDAGEVKVTLVMQALGPGGPGDGKIRETYYECSTGSSGGAAVIVFIVFFGLRRRRK